jgi:Rrf2 family protein
MLSQKTRYALKALLELAAQPEGNSLTAAIISERRSIPAKFLEAILVELRRHGVVRGQRGRHGGYELARRPAEISFGEIVRLMQGPLGLLACVSVTQYRRCSDCTDNETCELRRVFRVVRDNTSAILDGWTFAPGRIEALESYAAMTAARKPRAVKKSSIKGRAKSARRKP